VPSPRSAPVAAQKGYDVERAIMQGCYRLIDADRVPVRHADGSSGFTPKEAMAFLEKQPDGEHSANWRKVRDDVVSGDPQVVCWPPLPISS
jgi:hypothetical protein